MKTEVKLTRMQTNILTCIRNCVTKKGFPPSIREIGEDVGLSSSSTVHSHLKSLEKKGLLRRDRSKPRSIELLEGRPQPVATSPVIAYHKDVVDFVRGLRDDLAPIAVAPATIHEFNTPEQAQIAKIKAGATVAAYQKVLDHLLAISPLAGLQ